jgi:antitoxin component YwqK of YwqJK toxin-antitoxin module
MLKIDDLGDRHLQTYKNGKLNGKTTVTHLDGSVMSRKFIDDSEFDSIV